MSADRHQAVPHETAVPDLQVHLNAVYQGDDFNGTANNGFVSEADTMELIEPSQTDASRRVTRKILIGFAVLACALIVALAVVGVAMFKHVEEGDQLPSSGAASNVRLPTFATHGMPDFTTAASTKPIVSTPPTASTTALSSSAVSTDTSPDTTAISTTSSGVSTATGQSTWTTSSTSASTTIITTSSDPTTLPTTTTTTSTSSWPDVPSLYTLKTGNTRLCLQAREGYENSLISFSAASNNDYLVSLYWGVVVYAFNPASKRYAMEITILSDDIGEGYEDVLYTALSDDVLALSTSNGLYAYQRNTTGDYSEMTVADTSAYIDLKGASLALTPSESYLVAVTTSLPTDTKQVLRGVVFARNGSTYQPLANLTYTPKVSFSSSSKTKPTVTVSDDDIILVDNSPRTSREIPVIIFRRQGSAWNHVVVDLPVAAKRYSVPVAIVSSGQFVVGINTLAPQNGPTVNKPVSASLYKWSQGKYTKLSTFTGPSINMAYPSIEQMAYLADSQILMIWGQLHWSVYKYQGSSFKLLGSSPQNCGQTYCFYPNRQWLAAAGDRSALYLDDMYDSELVAWQSCS
eukprot:m.28421 g.28421  ORF g.28421 m.28421 type:complete len:576 (+) comp11835_c0_seq1:220-1947(+)